SLRSGTDRLAFFLAAVAAVLWLFFMGFWVMLFGGPVEGFKLLGKYYLLGAAAVFTVVMLFVHGIAWVFRGYRSSDGD
ncbi:MAG: hypothetical protein AAF725_04895, partial [Acidobacteriota bacterium]